MIYPTEPASIIYSFYGILDLLEIINEKSVNSETTGLIDLITILIEKYLKDMQGLPPREEIDDEIIFDVYRLIIKQLQSKIEENNEERE